MSSPTETPPGVTGSLELPLPEASDTQGKNATVVPLLTFPLKELVLRKCSLPGNRYSPSLDIVCYTPDWKDASQSRLAPTGLRVILKHWQQLYLILSYLCLLKTWHLISIIFRLDTQTHNSESCPCLHCTLDTYTGRSLPSLSHPSGLQFLVSVQLVLPLPEDAHTSMLMMSFGWSPLGFELWEKQTVWESCSCF